MKRLFIRLAIVAFLFSLVPLPASADDPEAECIAFCIVNQVICVSGGGTWHINCGDVNSYWIEETQTCEMGVGPCELND